jgi:predicted dehydrogenase
MSETFPTNIGVIGCGYVSDFYMATRQNYPGLRFVGAYDKDPLRLKAFHEYYGIRQYTALDEILSDPSVNMILNLTNPRSHFEVTKACLLAGKHVYSEKPLAMASDQAAELVKLGKQRTLRVATAPCTMLGETCQTLWRELNNRMIGPVRLVYASYDDGMTHRGNPTRWRSVSGAPWPAKDEFETGCTYEHALYILSWLAAFFGPARRVTAYAACRIHDKGVPVDIMAPDFSVGCIEYDNGVVARVTFSVIAPIDKSIMIVGDNGTLYTKYAWDAAAIYRTRTPRSRIGAAISWRLNRFGASVEYPLHLPWSISSMGIKRKVKFARKPSFHAAIGKKQIDFLRGPNELAASIREGRPCRLSAELGLHMTELIETLQYPERFERPRTISSSFDPIEPLPWMS